MKLDSSQANICPSGSISSIFLAYIVLNILMEFPFLINFFFLIGCSHSFESWTIKMCSKILFIWTYHIVFYCICINFEAFISFLEVPFKVPFELFYIVLWKVLFWEIIHMSRYWENENVKMTIFSVFSDFFSTKNVSKFNFDVKRVNMYS